MKGVHPIFSAFESDIYGNIIDTFNGKFKRKYLIMGTYYVCLRDGILYEYCNFIWECFNGILQKIQLFLILMVIKKIINLIV